MAFRLLAKIDYIQGNHTEAIEKQHKVSKFKSFFGNCFELL